MQSLKITVPTDQIPFTEEILWALGAQAVLVPEAETPHREITAMFDDRETSVPLEPIKQLLPQALAISQSEIPPQEWQSQWRDHFRPLQVGRLKLIGAWEASFRDAHTLVIQPGIAFGTGQHETTQLALQWMQELDLRGKRVMDIGCGSGILAIAAEKLGAAQVFGFDADSDCRDNMMEHLRLNACTRVTLRTGELPHFTPQPKDLILANITLNVLLSVWPQLLPWLAADGWLISTGILETQAGDALHALQVAGFHTLETRQCGEWIALLSRSA